MAQQQSAVLSAFKSAAGEQRYLDAYDAVLKAWPIAYQELDIPTCLGTSHVIVSGPDTGPALVLLPSMAGSATLWRPNIAALAAHFRCYAVDVIGQAGKSVASKRIKTREEFANWLDDLLDGLGVASASFVGNSYGGFLALNQAILRPTRVEKVILISPAGSFVGGLYWVFLGRMLKRMVLRQTPREITDILGNGAVLDESDKAWGELMKITLAESARPNLIPPVVFSKEELRTVHAPTLLLVGEKEILYKPERAIQRARELMPSITAAVIPNAHHLGALACPRDVNTRIINFLTTA